MASALDAPYTGTFAEKRPGPRKKSAMACTALFTRLIQMCTRHESAKRAAVYEGGVKALIEACREAGDGAWYGDEEDEELHELRRELSNAKVALAEMEDAVASTKRDAARKSMAMSPNSPALSR